MTNPTRPDTDTPNWEVPVRDVPESSTLKRFVATAMTMDFELLVDDERIDAAGFLAEIEATMEQIGDELRAIEAMFSTFRADSWVSRLNRGEVSRADCPPEVAEVLALCDRYAAVTGGAFDATTPPDSTSPDGDVDPTGIVKTWAMQQVLPRIEALGASRWLWGCSGDAIVGGAQPRPWFIGIADPRVARTDGSIVDRIALDTSFPAVATSGTSERGAHIWGPGGRSASSALSATVIGHDLVECDAWATALVAGGLATAHLAAESGLEFLLTTETDGRLVAHRSPNWPRS